MENSIHHRSATMKHISTSLLFLAGLALAGCSNMRGSGDTSGSMSGSSSAGTVAGASGAAPTTGGADSANADVKGSTSATGATPANTNERR
jgi:hypothetical protein